VVYLSETEAMPGEFVEVTITDATEYDLVGTAQVEKNRASLPPRTQRSPRKANKG